MKLTTIGLGYIGLPTSIMFAKHGVDVVGVDINKEAVDKLNNGQIHIEEPGLQEAYEEVLAKDKFKASNLFLDNTKPLHVFTAIFISS